MKRPIVVLSKSSLEDRIEALRAEIDATLEAKAKEIARGQGLPYQSILMMMGQTANGCQCKAALRLIAEQKRDKEIAESQQPAA
jgi:hypothetical protein